MCIGLKVETWFVAFGGTIRNRKRDKSMRVEFSSDMDDEDKLAAIISAADELQ